MYMLMTVVDSHMLLCILQQHMDLLHLNPASSRHWIHFWTASSMDEGCVIMAEILWQFIHELGIIL